MSPIPDNVVNKSLYQKIKDEIHAQDAAANRLWGKHSSARLVTTYKNRGGTYSGKKPAYKSPTKRRRSPQGEGGLRQWDDENWQDQYGRPCGSGKKGEVVKCRPTVRVNKSTPVTWNEIKASGKKSQIVNAKEKVGMGNRAPTIKKSPTRKSPTRKSPTKKSPTRKSPTKRGSMEGGVKVGRYYYKKSTKKGSKLMTEVDGKKIHFGYSSMQHYKDKTGIWSSKDHGDKDRRKNYLSRAKGIKKKDGTLAWKDPKSANYHAVRILW